jgi:hypothetical protein
MFLMYALSSTARRYASSIIAVGAPASGEWIVPRHVVHRHRVTRDLLGHLVIEVDRARIGELRELRLVLVELREQRLGRDATAIISRPSSVLPMEKTFTRGLAFSSMRMYS